ncbi:hypothetical protein D9M69_532410 [compost metagenome]
MAKVEGSDATKMSLSSASPAGVGVAVAFCNPAVSSSVTSSPVATTPKTLSVKDVVAMASSPVPTTPSAPAEAAVSRNVAPAESSGFTYHEVVTLPLTWPSRSPAPPSVTDQGSCPSPVLVSSTSSDVPHTLSAPAPVAWSTSSVTVLPAAKPLAVMMAVLPGA